MFPQVIYSWLLGILATAGTTIFVVFVILWIILGIKLFFD